MRLRKYDIEKAVQELVRSVSVYTEDHECDTANVKLFRLFLYRAYDEGRCDGVHMKHEPPCAGQQPDHYTCPVCRMLREQT